MFKVTLLMSELYSCMKVSLNSTQDEVINGRRVVGREGGCAGLLEVTRITGGHWGTLAAKLAMLQSVSRA